MSVTEIVRQVKTLPPVEQAELFKRIHRLEEEQKILNQFADVLGQPIQKEFIEIPEDQADYVLALLKAEKTIGRVSNSRSDTHKSVGIAHPTRLETTRLEACPQYKGGHGATRFETNGESR